MSSNDKAREKLMETMRTTKAGSEKKVDETGTEPQVDKPVKQKKDPAVAKKAVKGSPKAAAAPFISSRRVWPD